MENLKKEKLDGMSLDIESVEKEKLKSIFPQCFVEGKLDVQKLLDLCGEYEIKDFERYEFTWHGKSECLKNAQTRSHGTLRPCVEESKNFDETQNLYIEGDNLEVLKLLQNAYYNKVKMIYIDPPYNTENDFIYLDDYTDSIKNYKEITSQASKSNSEAMGRFHTNWLNMIYPRLRLAYNLLKDDGVIFISINDKEVHNLRKVCDEVFGEENFIDCLHWKRKKQPSFLAKHTAKVMEYIFVYAKNKDILEKLSIETLSDNTKKVINISNEESTRLFKKGVRIKLEGKGVIKADRYKIKTMEVEYLDDVVYEDGKTLNDVRIVSKFSVSQDRINEYVLGNLLFITQNLGLRRDVSEEEKQKRKSITDLLLSDYGDNQDSDKEFLELFDKKYFDYMKPTKLIYNLSKSIFSDNEIILDFFSGSATTAHAVMDLNKEDGGNRKFILVQLPELCEENTEAYKNGYKNICEIGKERIRRAGTKIEEEIKEHNEQLKIGEEEKPQVDTGFKVFKLDTSNVKIWDNIPIENVEEIEQIDMLTQRLNTMVETVKEDRTDLDLVYEILLKMGIELTESIIPQDFNGKKGYIVREDALLIICLDKEVKAEHVAEMIEYAPSTIVFAEDSFESLEEIENAKIQVNEKLGYEFGEKVKFRFV